MLIARSSIRLDGGTQPRAVINSPLFEEYAQAIADGATLPPVVVFYDGTDYWLADGFHRFYAHETLGLTEIDADVRQGTRRDAVLYSVGANADHGWRRSNEDKRRAVQALLDDPEWSGWSDREIARQCRVSAPLVAHIRPAASVNSYSSDSRTFKRKGSEVTMNVAAIGRTPRSLPLIAGREPDRRPDPSFGESEQALIGSASRVTGFNPEKLAAFARAGEIEGAHKEGGAWVFETEKLKNWMQAKPSVALAEPETPEPPVYDHEANRPFMAAMETLEAIVVGVSPAEMLAWWSTYSGGGFAGDAVAGARAWINYFAEGYPAAERSRQALLIRITEEACQ